AASVAPPSTPPPHPPPSTPFPYTTLFRSLAGIAAGDRTRQHLAESALQHCLTDPAQLGQLTDPGLCHGWAGLYQTAWRIAADALDRKSTRLNSSHVKISYAVFCLKNKISS